MIYEIVFSYLAIGVAWIAIELWSGGAAHLGRRCSREAQVVPPALLPLMAFIVAVASIFALTVVVVAWPFFVWHDWRNGWLFNPSRWGDDKE